MFYSNKIYEIREGPAECFCCIPVLPSSAVYHFQLLNRKQLYRAIEINLTFRKTI